MLCCFALFVCLTLLASFFLPSFSSLIKTCMYVCMYVIVEGPPLLCRTLPCRTDTSSHPISRCLLFRRLMPTIFMIHVLMPKLPLPYSPMPHRYIITSYQQVPAFPSVNAHHIHDSCVNAQTASAVLSHAAQIQYHTNLCIPQLHSGM